MAFARAHHNLTLLPDGTVLATGGGGTTAPGDLAGAVYETELWSPVTESWTTMAPMQVPRLYHSTALLLPDGRVLVAGGTRPIKQLSAEIYSPPYLFRGPRPRTTSLPSVVQYGATFFVETPDASSIASVTLVRPGVVTHTVDMNQRYLSLTFQHAGSGLDVQAPASPNLAPPGYYMLFVVDTNGVPSIAPFVRLEAGQLAIYTVALPDGMVGAAYDTSLSASGGTPPYTWSIVPGSGSLPDGLTLSAAGLISGIPTLEETSSFTVQVQDNAGDIVTQGLSITVTPALAAQGTLIISTDNADEVYLNGKLLGSSNDWFQASTYGVGLQAGINVIAVNGMDAGGVAALIAELTWSGNVVVSDGSWKVSTVEEPGWQDMGFDDSLWSLATEYGAYGVGPWLKRVSGFPDTSSANWIWSSDNNANNTVYFRYTFAVGPVPLAIDTVALPDGMVGAAYDTSLSASGGTPPYTWSIVPAPTRRRSR